MKHVTGAYTAEDLGDWSWQGLSYGVILLYHFLFLQPVGMVRIVYARRACFYSMKGQHHSSVTFLIHSGRESISTRCCVRLSVILFTVQTTVWQPYCIKC